MTDVTLRALLTQHLEEKLDGYGLSANCCVGLACACPAAYVRQNQDTFLEYSLLAKQLTAGRQSTPRLSVKSLLTHQRPH